MVESKTPIISVVMVNYNDARYLGKTLQSLLDQTFRDFEIIFIDNGSTDNSVEVAESFDDSRLKIFRNENIGLSQGYNVGISHAKGRWIAISNTDDLWLPDRFEEQAKYFDNEKIGVVFTAAQLIDDQGNPVSEEATKAFPFSFENLEPHKMYEKLFFRTNFLCAPSAIIRKELVLEHPFHAMLLQLQDFEMWATLIQKCEFRIVEKQLTLYRVRTDGSNLSLNTQNRSRVLVELEIAYTSILENVDAEFFRSSFKSHLRNPSFQGEIALLFEKAFLYLKMDEAAIRLIGIRLLYNLMSKSASRKVGQTEYGLSMNDVWTWALTPLFADSQSMESAKMNFIDLHNKLKEVEDELASTKNTMRSITSGKLWKLRERFYGLLGR